ncbi:MAG: DUF3667 domain-containing protein [Gammaproteobacteria bacterium]|jgi:hypothetical protein|nr:DUF3667 domain-containing protein [Gammaproteobacteria bacterium]MBT4493196.1 DUF3667 domain-containing protein [Gammaproteobacteria bacterium]MBT7369636.1 DUF3667 domain-containing protein [Gammaproteobacteria bacterium]
MIPSTKVALCPNCDTEITGPFCATCGQEQKELKKFFWTLLADAFDNVFRLDSRAARSIFAAIFLPGYLTTEYFAGRRARYVPPIRLYLVISFLFFFILPLVTEVVVDGRNTVIVTEGESESDWREELNTESFEIDLPWMTAEENQALAQKLKKRIGESIQKLDENPGELYSEFMDLISVTMFFLLPVFAVLLKIFYLGHRIYYAEHLLLAVHNHCFLYLALLFLSLLEHAVSTSMTAVAAPVFTAINIWIPIYIYLSMLRVYQQGYFVTLLKFSFLALSYWILALMGFIAAITFNVMVL